MAIEKFCTRCGKKFQAIGREVICPACKEQAAEESKKAAVLRAKRASWAGESVPVRISGRASTLIREYGKANCKPFAAALDDLLKSSDFFKSTGKAWEDITPYKSHRRDKSTTTSTTEDETGKQEEVKPQEVKPQEVPQEVKTAGKQSEPVKPVKQAAKKAASKTVKKGEKA